MYKEKALKNGTVLNHGKHPITITDTLTNDAQGFTYRGVATINRPGERTRKMDVVIREHFMAYCSERAEDGMTVSTPDDILPTVVGCLETFKEASQIRREISDSHSAIINVQDGFDENNTYYYVVEFLKGPTLEEYIAEHGPLSVEKANELLSPIFMGAIKFHYRHSIHTGLTPKHIRFTSSNGKMRPVIFSLYTTMHFDENGRRNWDVQSINCLDGYAPPEQYGEIEQFLPQVDIYSLAATFVFTITGRHLPDSRSLTEESLRDALPPTLPETYTEALLHALCPDYTQRTASLSSFFDDMNLSCNEEQRAHRSTEEDDAEEPADGKLSHPGQRPWHMRIMGVVALIAIITAIIAVISLF